MTDDPPRRPIWVRIVLLGLCAALVVVFVSLGNWQMRRLDWKLDLIDAVEARAFGNTVAMPEVFDPEAHAYLRVRVIGQPANQILRVKAVTELGPGHWIMSPLETESGVIWINRGLVTASSGPPSTWTAMPDTLEGLLRPSEPEGTLLERNDPEADRWVSRDTMAMSQAQGLGPTLPFFLDADHVGEPEAWPRGGLTIVKFRNTHLSYALTWYAMAGLLLTALIVLVWRGRRH